MIIMNDKIVHRFKYCPHILVGYIFLYRSYPLIHFSRVDSVTWNGSIRFCLVRLSSHSSSPRTNASERSSEYEIIDDNNLKDSRIAKVIFWSEPILGYKDHLLEVSVPRISISNVIICLFICTNNNFLIRFIIDHLLGGNIYTFKDYLSMSTLENHNTFHFRTRYLNAR